VTNDERRRVCIDQWRIGDRIWRLGLPAEVIAKAYGYKKTRTFLSKVCQVRNKYPDEDLFPVRPPGYKPCLVLSPDAVMGYKE